MPTVKDYIEKLKKSLSKIDVDPTEYTLPVSKLNQHRFKSQIRQSQDIYSEISKLVNQFQPAIPKNIMYIFNSTKSMYQSVPEYYQAINTVLDNLLSPDSVTKNSINVKIDIDDDSRNALVTSNCSRIFTSSDIESLVMEIALDFLLYGNAYVWIKTPQDLRKMDLLKDSINMQQIIVDSIGNGISNRELQHLNRYVDPDFSFITISPSKKKTAASKRNDKMLSEAPKDVTNTQIDADVILDQISIERLSVFRTAPIYIARKFLGLVIVNSTVQNSGITGPSNNNPTNMQSSALAGTMPSGSSDIMGKGNVDNLAMGLLTALQKKVQSMNQLLDPDNSETLDIFYAIASHIVQNNLKMTNMMYIPEQYCTHFRIPSSLLNPYGEPFGMGTLHIAKYLLASEMAQIIYRLTRAAEKRIFKINAQEEHAVAKYIQDVINVTKRKEVALRNASDTETIINEVTMFEDYYVPVVNGETTMDIELQPAGDLTGRVEDLDYFRKKMISGMGIPAIYLIQEDTSESKYTLSQENIKFARTIIKLQKFFGASITDMFRKIYSLVFNDETNSEYIFLNLKPPRAIQLERNADMADALARVVNAIKDSVGDDFNAKAFISDTLEDILGGEYFTEDSLGKKSRLLDKFVKKKEDDTTATGF